MTASDEAELAALRKLQAQAHDVAHEMVSVLQVFLGELDLAVANARGRLNDFYERYPELR